MINPKLLEPTLLWTNEYSNQAFEPQLISIPTISNYKYIIIGYMGEKGTNQITRYLKVKYQNGGFCMVSDIPQDSSIILYASRVFEIKNTGLDVRAAYVNQNVNNVYLIPAVIYGTNIL